MVNLKKAFEIDDGIMVNGSVIPDSVFSSTRSLKQTYSGDLVTSISFYNSLTQTNEFRIVKVDLTYDSNEFVVGQVTTYYEADGVTVFKTSTITYNYDGDVVDDVEVV
jgi:hypothetical protein